MFLKTGAISLSLLLASRIAGLLRESAQAAAFGATGEGDLVVLMLTLPDLVSGVLAGGALTYVLLPLWAGQAPAQLAAAQRQVAWGLLGLGLLLAVLVLLSRPWLLPLLAPGLPETLRAPGLASLGWSALAIPAALLAALWVTRLQHERDFLGMYAANLVFTGCLVAALLFIAATHNAASGLTLLGGSLLVAAAARLAWLYGRQRPFRVERAAAPALPVASVWIWAVLAAGLPLLLPFVARSLVSQAGEGALATFGYAWKLAELPLVMAVQLVATLAFPAVTRAMAQPGGDASVAVRGAFSLAWVAACACAAGLLVGSQALASLLFGWGRMAPGDVARIAQWGGIAAWGLLPQALVSVSLAVLASDRSMHRVVWAYGLALGAVVLAGSLGWHDGARMMAVINLCLCFVAAATVPGALGRARMHWLPWREMAAPLAVLGVIWLGIMASGGRPGQTALGLALAVLAGLAVLVAGWISGPAMRQALAR